MKLNLILIHTIPLLSREHLDFFLYYIRYKTYGITQSQTQFQIFLIPVGNSLLVGTRYSQITQFQYNFFQNLTLKDDTILQIKVIARIFLIFFRFNYQLKWVQQDQSAYTNFPQVFEEIDLLPFIIGDDFKHSLYVNSLQLHIPFFDIITFDNKFLVEHSETSDSRPYATITTIETHTTPADTNIQINDPNELLCDTSESQVQYEQQNPQTTQPITQQPRNVQLETLSLQPNENPNNGNIQDELQNPNPTLDTQKADSNSLLVPVRRDAEQNIKLSTEQNPQHLIQGSSILFTSRTPITQSQKHLQHPESIILLPGLKMKQVLLPYLNNQVLL